MVTPSVCRSCSSALLEGYFSYTATEDQLEQAKSWYNQMMDSAEKGKAFEQAIMPAQMLSQVPYFSRDERRKNFALHYVERGAGLSRRLKNQGLDQSLWLSAT